MAPRAGPRWYSREELERLGLTTARLVGAVERVLGARERGLAWNAPKAVLEPPDGRYLMATLSACSDPPVVAVKALVLNPRNSARGLPDIQSLVTLQDGDTGRPLALLDGAWVTEVRTAAVSAVAAQRLARPDSAIAAFIGCGIQARSHLTALADLFPLTEVRAFGRGAANRDRLVALAESRGLRALPAASAESAIRGADIVVSAVTLERDMAPFLDAGWLSPGATALIIDLARSWHRATIPMLDRLVVDDLEQERQSAEPMTEAATIAGDLTGLVAGRVAGRASPTERNAFLFRGLALGDLAVGKEVLEY